MNRQHIADYLGLDEPIDGKYFDVTKIQMEMSKLKELISDISRLDEADDSSEFHSIAGDLDYYSSALDDVNDYLEHLENKVDSHEVAYDSWSREVEERLENDEVREIGELETMEKLKGKR